MALGSGRFYVMIAVVASIVSTGDNAIIPAKSKYFFFYILFYTYEII